MKYCAGRVELSSVGLTVISVKENPPWSDSSPHPSLIHKSFLAQWSPTLATTLTPALRRVTNLTYLESHTQDSVPTGTHTANGYELSHHKPLIGLIKI